MAIGTACLAEVGTDRIELPPGDDDVVRIRRVDGDRRLICGVSDDVVAELVDIDLHADEAAAGR